MKAESTSPAERNTNLHFFDYIKINIFGFAINVLWNPMSTVLLPILVLQFAGESVKNTYLGLVTSAGIILAIIVQPIAGAISDGSSFKWGKRRPYIFIGSVLLVITLPFIGIINNLALLFLVYCVLQIASNIANGPWNGLIPDRVPGNKRGTAAGVKGAMEVSGAVVGILVIGMIMSEGLKWLPGAKLFLSLAVIGIVFLACMLVTVLTVREKPGVPAPKTAGLAALRNIFSIAGSNRKNFLYFLISRLLFMIPLFVLRTFGLYLFRDVTHVQDPVAMISYLTAVVAICVLIAVFPTGFLADRIGRRPVVVLSAILGIAGFSMLLFSWTEIPILVGGGLIGLGNGAFMSANWAMATEITEKGHEARYLGLTNLATGGASLLANTAGPVMDFFYNMNIARTGYEIVLVFCIALFVISGLLVFKIKIR